jgi:hypothetical protein
VLSCHSALRAWRVVAVGRGSNSSALKSKQRGLGRGFESWACLMAGAAKLGGSSAENQARFGGAPPVT